MELRRLEGLKNRLGVKSDISVEQTSEKQDMYFDSAINELHILG